MNTRTHYFCSHYGNRWDGVCCDIDYDDNDGGGGGGVCVDDDDGEVQYYIMVIMIKA